MSKLALFLAISSIIFLSGCSVTKKLNKAKTETESESKVDSSGSVKKDVETISKIETITTEEVDTTIQITPAGKLITDPKEVTKESIAVPIKKKKTTKRTEAIKETDKTQTKAEVKREEKKEEKQSGKQADIKNTGILWYWWLILALIAAGYCAWRFYLRRL